MRAAGRMAARWCAIAGVALLAAVGCKKEEAVGPPGTVGERPPPPMTEAQARQVRDACEAYVAHVCGCAAASAADMALADQCTLARTIPDALDLAIRSAQAEHESVEDVFGVQANVGKIQKSCIEEGARLETRCPRASIPPAGGATPPSPTPGSPAGGATPVPPTR